MDNAMIDHEISPHEFFQSSGKDQLGMPAAELMLNKNDSEEKTMEQGSLIDSFDSAAPVRVNEDLFHRENASFRASTAGSLQGADDSPTGEEVPCLARLSISPTSPFLIVETKADGDFVNTVAEASTSEAVDKSDGFPAQIGNLLDVNYVHDGNSMSPTNNTLEVRDSGGKGQPLSFDDLVVPLEYADDTAAGMHVFDDSNNSRENDEIAALSKIAESTDVVGMPRVATRMHEFDDSYNSRESDEIAAPSKIAESSDAVEMHRFALEMHDFDDSDNSRETDEIVAPSKVAESNDVVEMHKVDDSPKVATETEDTKGLIDTAAPFESVKEAVSKFGGILDWKAHKIRAKERRKVIEEELERANEEIPEYGRLSELAEVEKVQVLTELDSTKRLVEELKLNLERAQTEEQQAKQDAELARLRIEEMEQGIAEESSVAAKAQLEVAKARHAAAVSELKSVKDELDAIKDEYLSLIDEKSVAEEQTEEAVSTDKAAEKKVELLTIDLMTTREALESAQAAHLEAEEQRKGVALEREEDCLAWETQLNQVKEELKKLKQEVESTNDLKSKLDAASALLHDLKAELKAHMQSKLNQEAEVGRDPEESLEDLEKELEEVKLKIEKVNAEINSLKDVAATLNSELEREKGDIATIKQKEEMASNATESLQRELDETRSEIALAKEKQKAAQEKIVELPKKLEQAAEEANQAKLLAQTAREELEKAKEEAEQAKDGESMMDSRLNATLKEIDAAKESEKLALAAINAMKESESSQKSSDVDSSKITLTLHEYYELSRRANEAEEEANMKVDAALSQIEIAKEAEVRSLKELQEVTHEMLQRKEALRDAMDRVEKAKEEKLQVEQELRKWRAENEQRRKSNEVHQEEINSNPRPDKSYKETNESNSFISIPGPTVPVHNTPIPSPHEAPPPTKKKKKSIFPRILMFLARRKAHKSHS